ncbi:acyl carrier protein [Marinomonas primoryensis]|jgi:acyl carrier protein|uniref:Acyl carrier protein n=1 Tax=Marinomonas primoryensis TaxID=178399 RepID=A0A2Z4PQ82_9GAMM|nr:acyl carrier protein [Marinomonas primoryensis]AWX99606.1 acyl carrier protein [Marinomonas primoryensis]|tara:strand:+ start:2111 stop:2359 length:249 start_codon:yes stop_codon:yes gene_type:complete
MSSINQDVFDKVSGVLQELFELSAENIHPSSNLYQDLDIDSIDAVDLVVELKKMTGKKINPEDFKSVRTVEDVVIAVEKLFV